MLHRTSFDDLFSVFRDFDNLFRRTFSDAAPWFPEGRLLTSGSPRVRTLAQAASRWDYVPAVESYMKDGKLFLRAELPGVEPSDIQVSVTGNTLTLSGEKKTTRELDEKNLFYRESSYGRFERSFSLPEGVKSDLVKARFENGVLELSMPSPAHEEPKKLQIEVVPEAKPSKAA
jgi:HSP20 family protein